MKKLLSVLLVLVMVMGLASVSLAEDKPVITMMNRLPASFVVENNPVLQKVEEINGITLDLEAPPINNYADRVSVVMASGDMPDLLYYQTDNAYLPNIQSWVQDGLILPLDDYLDQLPHAMAVLDETALTVASIYDEEGHIYGMTRVQTKPHDALIIRQDWLDNLGLEAPKTPEEYAAVMHAFTYDDPDGNGVQDTFGFSMVGKQERNVIYGFGLVPSTVPASDGKYHCLEDQEGWMKYADWLHDLYADGSLDSEWYLNETYGDMDRFDEGKSGSFFATSTCNHIVRDPGVTEANPGMVPAAIPPLRENADERAVDYYEPQMWGIWLLNADLADDPDHLADVLAFLDWGYTDEANMLLLLGIEGITYDEFDEVTRVAVKGENTTAQNATLYTASYATFNYQLEDKGLLVRSATSEEEGRLLYETDAYLGEETEYRSFVKEAWIPGVLTLQSELAELTTEKDDMFTKYVCGNITREAYVDYLQNTWIPANQPIIEIIEAFFAE